VDGEIQTDFCPRNVAAKIPFSKTGKKVNTLIFPNLESGNSTYK
jgi:malate dehydrogenase (oxaloacetate-decarboxylating)(NADP+)